MSHVCTPSVTARLYGYGSPWFGHEHPRVLNRTMLTHLARQNAARRLRVRNAQLTQVKAKS